MRWTVCPYCIVAEPLDPQSCGRGHLHDGVVHTGVLGSEAEVIEIQNYYKELRAKALVRHVK